MSSNNRSTSQRFLPQAIRTFLWGRAARRQQRATENQHGQFVPCFTTWAYKYPTLGNTTEPAPVNPPEVAPPPTHLPTHDNSDARSDSSMPDLLSDGSSDSDSSQEARDVEMDIVPDDQDDTWVDDDNQVPPLPTVSVGQPQAADRHARVEDEVEPLPSQSNPTPNPAPTPLSHPGMGASQPFSTPLPWNFGLGTARDPGRLFNSFPNSAGISGNATNATPRRGDTPTNPATHPPQPDRNPATENTQQDAREPRFHAQTFVVGMDGTARPIPISPDAFSALFGQFGAVPPRPQTQIPQPAQPPDQQGETPGQPGDAGQVPPFVDFVVGGIGTFPPLFATPGPGPQPDPGNGGGPEPGRGAPAWAELLRAMLGGEPPEEKEDPERAKKLVDGLERVPIGLVKRMTRLDGVPGAHEDSTGTDGGEAPGCAICWDGLLPEEPSEDAKLQSDSTTPLKSEHPTEGSDSNPAVSDPAPVEDTSTTIICLPCSHVFHASCLIPWFSKPKHTTCPTCRFDIDPMNLTYTPPSRRPRPTPTTTTTNPPDNPQPQPVPNPTTATANPPLPSTAHQEHDHGHQPPVDPLFGVHQPQGHIHVEPPMFFQDFFATQPQQGPGPPAGETQDDAPNDGHDIPPPVFGFGFGPQQPPVFGPPPPPGHPTHGTHATAADAPHDHGDGPHPEADFFRGGVGHAHFHGPGVAIDFTLHVPAEQGLDPERISQAVRDQAAAFLQFFAGGGRGTGAGQPTGPGLNPGTGGVNLESQDPREWVPPPAPGPTLRQRVESRERKAGLRCDDTSCGIGPSDEDPFPEVFNDPNSPSVKRVGILKDGGDEVVCGHVFHPACLVSADRCAGWGEKDRPSQSGDEEYEVVSCPVCRGVGKVPMEVWEEGAKTLLV